MWNASNGARKLRRERFPSDFAGQDSAFAQGMSTVPHEQRRPADVEHVVVARFLNQLLHYSGHFWAPLGRVMPAVFAGIGRFKEIQERDIRRCLVHMQKMLHLIAQTLFESFHCSDTDSGTDEHRGLRNIWDEAAKRRSQFDPHARDEHVVHVPCYNSAL
jgi:hypothetical protein